MTSLWRQYFAVVIAQRLDVIAQPLEISREKRDGVTEIALS